jgi:tRNA(adenine34) deaminase
VLHADVAARPFADRLTRRDALCVGLAGGLAAALGPAASAAAPATPIAKPAQAYDERFMRLALAEARQGDLPFGTVIVRDGAVLARGFNSGARDHDPTAHGEMVAIRAFLAAHGPEALTGTTLYTTGEPCPMCTGAIIWCGIGRIVYAASIAQLATKLGQIMVSSHDIAAKAPFATLEITGGVLSAEALALFS